MKFHETHFEDYLNTSKAINLHPKLDKQYRQFPDSIHDLKNVIFYGPPGVGKYTQMLKVLRLFSPSELKYEKKISVNFNKQSYFFKISDIHYEIDMSLLGCNSKLLWHEIFQQIIDIISAKQDKVGIIVCKYFHEIHSELLDNFYSYMQQNYLRSIDLKFFLVTEHIGFLPDNILHCCQVIHVPRPLVSAYKKCIPDVKETSLICNIKNLYEQNPSTKELDPMPLMQPHKIICDKIIGYLESKDTIPFSKFRDLLYDILIYNLNISDCIEYIFSQLQWKEEYKSEALIKTYTFFQYYNNNYRPIYHLENYFYYLSTFSTFSKK